MSLIVVLRRICLFVPFLRRFLCMPAVLYIVRHAESEHNQRLGSRRYLPATELSDEIEADHRVPVTTEGERQIHETAARFYTAIGSVPDVVVHSGYVRTEQTAGGLVTEFRKHNPRVIVLEDIGLRERENGYSYFMSQEQVVEQFPFLASYWSEVKGFFARPVGGESLLSMVENRLRWVIRKLWKRYPGRKVCLVTHGRVKQCLRYMFDGLTWEQMEAFLADKDNQSPNCSITVYRYDPRVGKLVLAAANQVLYTK